MDQKFDLKERTIVFAENIINSVRSVKVDAVNSRIITQSGLGGFYWGKLL